MRANATKHILRDGRVAIGTFCSGASPLIAEALGCAGYDFIVVDLQHGETSLGNLQGMLQALSGTRATPMVRVPANMPVYIQRALDLGAYGIIVPLVNSKADAQAVIASVRYAPEGARSWGPIRAALYAGSDYLEKAAEELVTIVMLETAEGVRNAREILSVSGVDGCFIGPMDLSISLGFPIALPELPPPVEEAIGSVLVAASAAGKYAGIHVFSTEEANRRIAQGFQFVSVMTDFRMVKACSASILQATRHSAPSAS